MTTTSAIEFLRHGSRRRLTAAAMLALLPASAGAATLQVGPDKPYTTVAAAVAAAGAGDVIEIDPGEYVDDIVVIDAGDITLRGVGEPRAHLSSTHDIDNGKGIILVNSGAAIVTVEHLELSDATVADANGAGIRMQGTALVVRDCHFHDNQNGILAGGDGPYTVEVHDSEFDHNGNPGSGYEHNIYISGEATSFTFQGNYSHHAYSGHTLKSRAQTNYILYNRIMDEQDGTSSYIIDLSQGGRSYVLGNLLQKGPMSENSGTVLSFAAEMPNPMLELYVVGNTFVNDGGNAPAFVRAYAATDIIMRNNLFVGAGTPLALENGIAPTVVDEGNLATEDAGLVDRAGYDYHLLEGSAAIDAAVAPGEAAGYDLTPLLHYLHPASTEPRPVVDALDVGAYEFGMGPPAGDTGGADSGDSGGGGSDSAGGSGSEGGGSASAGGDSAGSAGSATGGSGESGSDGTAGGDEGGGGCGCRSGHAPTPQGIALVCAVIALRRRRGAKPIAKSIATTR
ncbi:MAG: right-handed parallel beta-helix repeat-containing protein [Nannocystaceae bacterium]|nr:right-handed parallel beta-helix repeat-containing protein [Nannocystaceae bacterium]